MEEVQDAPIVFIGLIQEAVKQNTMDIVQPVLNGSFQKILVQQ
jgi:hypothetical protein